MKKIFLTLVFCLPIIFSSASAQDIYASNKDGYEYYVISETVSREEITHKSDSGRVFHGATVTGNVKKIRDGKLIKVQEWKFSGFFGHAATYFIDGVKSGSLNSREAEYAHKIMLVMNDCVKSR